MKRLINPTQKDSCQMEIHEEIWGKDIEIISARFRNPIPRIVYIHKTAKEKFDFDPLNSTGDINRVSIQDIYPHGAKFKIDDKDVELPIGSYLTYNDKFKHGLYYKNAVIVVDGLALDNFFALEDGNYLNDIKVFDNKTYLDFGDGFYNFSGMMMQEDGKKAKLEFSHIQKHIYEPTTVAPIEGVEGHFIFVGTGDIDVSYLDEQTNSNVIKTFEQDSMIYVTKEFEIVGGDNYNVYEFYLPIDKEELYKQAE